MPRAKPAGSTFQLASADAQIVQPPKPKQAVSAERVSIDKAEPKPQTPADIINARGFWDAVPRQATPAQVAAVNARKALNSADPQSTASVSAVFNKALAYAPAASRQPRQYRHGQRADSPQPRPASRASRGSAPATGSIPSSPRDRRVRTA